jgi:hypothetical protein
MSVVRVYRKAVVERRLLHLDYSCWLEDQEVLTDFQVTVMPYTADAPVVVNTGFPDDAHKELVFYASGGLANTNYVLQMVVRTSAGQVKRDDIGLRVTP